jgi:hypothetical protein
MNNVWLVTDQRERLGLKHCGGRTRIRRSTGKPIENAYIESFNGRFRDGCLNEALIPDDGTRVIEPWRIEYNTERTHSSLGELTPERFARNALSTTTTREDYAHDTGRNRSNRTVVGGDFSRSGANKVG